jgi:FdhD protein
MRGVVTRRRVRQIRDGATAERADDLVAEEPMEIRVDGARVAVTMRTPGADFDLALGFCLTEGIVDDPDEVATIRYCPDPGMDQRYNLVDVRRRTALPVEARLRRDLPISSACGICGTASIDEVRARGGDVSADPVVVTGPVIAALPDRLRQAQRVFARTGGLHAAGLFTPDGELLCLREDVGRHNAVDKVLGWAARDGRLPARGTILMVSGRVAFEIVAKGLVAGIPVLAAVSAPSSLAVSAADAAGMTLVGFVRGASMNVYTGAHRIVGTS